MTEWRFKAVIRRLKTDKLEEWLAQLYDMYEYGKMPVLLYIINIKKEIEERGERNESGS